MRRSVIVLGILAALSGTALQARTGTVLAQMSSDSKNSNDSAFRAAFRSTALSQCAASAPAAVASNYDISPTCHCAADTLLSTRTMEQLILIARDSSGAAVDDATAQCLKSNPPVPLSKQVG